MRMTIPDGWTDDMNVTLPPGTSNTRVVDVVLGSVESGESYAVTIKKLVELGLSEDDADLAYDRTMGGTVRAETGNMSNEPSQTKDPLAWISFHRHLKTQKSATKGWWQFWK